MKNALYIINISRGHFDELIAIFEENREVGRRLDWDVYNFCNSVKIGGNVFL